MALPDNQHALSGSADNTAKLFNVNDGAVLRTFNAPRPREPQVNSLARCPTASASSAARSTAPPASCTTASRRSSERDY